MSTKVKLTNVRLSFPVLWKGKEFKAGDGKPRYSATFLIEPGSENDKAIREAIKAEAVATYAKKADANLKAWEGQSNKYCYQNGANKEYEGYDGMWYLATHRKASEARPTIIDRDRSPLTEDDGRPYAGCYVDAIVSIYAQTGENPGIRGTFSGIQFRRDGAAFSGASIASIDEFDELTAEEDDDLI